MSDWTRNPARAEEWLRSADGKETVVDDKEATIMNLIRENNRREAEIIELRAALDNERAAHAVACQMRDEAVQIQRNASAALDELREENERLQAALWHVREDMAQLVQQVDKALEQSAEQK